MTTWTAIWKTYKPYEGPTERFRGQSFESQEEQDFPTKDAALDFAERLPGQDPKVFDIVVENASGTRRYEIDVEV